MTVRDWFSRKTEARSFENPNDTTSFVEFLNASGAVEVTIDAAMGVPAIWDAVNFLSGTLASLPLHLYRRTKDGQERVKSQLATLLHDAVNDEMSSFEWRKFHFGQVFTGGRGISFIERNGGGAVINIWPLDANNVTVKRQAGGPTLYEYRDGTRTVTYSADEVIDTAFARKPDGLASYSPIMANRDTVQLAISATRYGARFFDNGGVPPFVVETAGTTPAGLQRASDDLLKAVKVAAKDKRLALVLPAGVTAKPLGVDIAKTQLLELQKFLVCQFARIYQLPPVFLQDLERATFTNSEQQDLHLGKHTLGRWVQQFEQELNLKLFGRRSTSQFVMLNVDGLLRGDFKTRMEGHGIAIQNALRTPNESRALENLPALPNGDELLIQGATVPLGTQPEGTTDATQV
jgi:HK97 family phage portal protein